MNATPASADSIHCMPRPFGDLPWPVPGAEPAAQAVLKQARRHCPDWRDAPSGFDYRVTAVHISFAPHGSGYELVRLSLHPRAEEPPDQPVLPPPVYALHAPGDFRPLDGEGCEFERFRLQAPIDFSAAADRAAGAAEYGCLRLALEAPFIFGRLRATSADGGSASRTFEPAAIVSSVASLPLDVDRLDAERRARLMRIVRVPTVVAERAPDARSEDDRVYRVEASVCFVDAGGLRVLRAVVVIDRYGAISTDPAEWLDAGTLADVATDELGAAGLHAARTLQRIAPVVGVDEWQRAYPGAQPEALDWVRLLLAEHGLPPDTTVLRRARLPFYRTFDLIEVIERAAPAEPARCAYALVRFGEQEEGPPLDVRALNGQSYVVHGVNDVPGELVLDEATVEPYLRFFCWAVHGDRGPFLIPAAAREIPLAGRLKWHDARVLDHLDYRMLTADPGEPRFAQYSPEAGFLLPRRAIVAYGGAVFESWFAVQRDGTISMIDDTPLVADLPMEIERHGRGALFELRSWKRSPHRPAPRSVWQLGAPLAARPRHAALEGGVMSGDAWREPLERCEADGKVVVADRDVTSPLVLASGAAEAS